jgi:NADH-quinone oxidoreductase subunit L
MQKMGNLRKYMPITFVTFGVGSLANAGLVPFSGFWSKDELIAGSWASAVFPFWGKVVAIVLLISALLTALHMFRLFFLVFYTKERFDTHEIHPHEAGPAMSIPLILLAIPSFLIGFIGFPPDDGRFHHFLEPVLGIGHEAAATDHDETASLYTVQATDAVNADEPAEAGAEHEISNTVKWTFAVLSTLFALTGIVLAYMTYVTERISRYAVADRFRGLYEFFFHKWGIDELYDRMLVQPARNLALFLWKVVDVKIIDATVNGVAYGLSGLSQRLRHVQTGLVANYALAIALGMVVMVGVYLAAFSNLFR